MANIAPNLSRLREFVLGMTQLVGRHGADEPRMLALSQKMFAPDDPDFGGAGGDREQKIIAALLDLGPRPTATKSSRAASRTTRCA